jgi:predicted dehydrogenase
VVSTDFDAVLADPEIDLVHICLPPHLHFSATKAALEAGKHVVCEKPLVPSLAQADALIAVADAAGKSLFPVFQYRFGLAMAQLNALKAAGLIGTAYAASIETHWNRDADYYAVDWRGTWAGENGGSILGHAIHNHDLLTCLLGPIKRLSAAIDTRVNDIETEDCAAINFVMESGALVTSSITLGAANDVTRLKLCFDGLTAESGASPYAPMSGGWTFLARNPVLQQQVDEVLSTVSDVPQGFAGFMTEIADHLDHGSGTPVMAADGRRSLELITAIYHSAREQTWVSLPLNERTPLYYSWAPAKN